MGPTNNVCTAIYRWNTEKEELEFLVFKARSFYSKTGSWSEWAYKFPGGGQDGPNETVEGTRDREVWQELSLAFKDSKKIWQNEVFDRDGRLVHIKHGYLVNFGDCWGDLRTEPKSQDGDEMGVPEWVSLERLKYELFQKHQPILLAAGRELGIF